MFSSRMSRRQFLARTPGLIAVPAMIGALGSGRLRQEPAAAVGISGVTGTVSASDGGLNLRSGPSSSNRSIRWLTNGTNLSIIGTSSDWFKVSVAGQTGWVSSWYVVLSGAGSTAISRGNTARNRMALTFDAGSDLGYTEKIIGILEKHRITASFGLTGDWVNAYPDYAAWIAADGYQLLNHTLKHPSYTGASTGSGPLSPAKRLAQIQANENIIVNATGRGCFPYWRPPFGDYDAGVLRDVGALGYSKTVMWTVDSMGWNGYSADQIYQRVLSNSGNGAVVLMHVGSASQDANALDRIIKKLESIGYRFGTVAQVIGG